MSGHAGQHDLFHTVVEMYSKHRPDAIALVGPEGQMTYQELAARSTALARQLIARGLHPEQLVGVYLDRSFDLIVCLLGVLKAGGVYMPLDPANLPKRIHRLIDDATPRFVIASTASGPRSELDSSTTLDLDSLHQSVSSAEFSPLRTVNPHSAAYVIYTSGSTGEPKGVVVEHKNLAFACAALRDLFALVDDTVLQFFPISFDGSLLEITLALASGATLCIAPRNQLTPGLPLAETVNKYAVSCLILTPTALSSVPTRTDLASVRTLAVGGEQCTAALVNRWARPGRRFINMYGTTETTIISSASDCAPNESDPSIGEPLGETRLYLLDKQMAKVGPGESGELYIGGPGVARSYLNRIDLTEERFISDPFSSDGSRLYRTGDLMIKRADGSFEYRGRSDNQIKIRGFRVELGEIEAEIRAQQGVRDSAIVAVGRGVEQRLVAHIVLDSPTGYSSDDAREDSVQHVDEWRSVYDHIYRSPRLVNYTSVNVAGWSDTTTGEPIPDVEMNDWIAASISRVRLLTHERVLEIGCGTGALLTSLISDTEDYWASDISEIALDYVREHANASSLGRRPTLLLQAADDFSRIPQGYFDLVILNSTMQYFPTLDYLRRFLKLALSSLRRDGSIYFGDVRNLATLDAQHVLRQLGRASLGSAILAETVQQSMRQEQELIVHPDIFLHLAAETHSNIATYLYPRRGRFFNEMSRFRFDAILSASTTAPSNEIADVQYHEILWHGRMETVTSITTHLRARSGSLIVRSIPDRRILPGLRAAQALREQSSITSKALQNDSRTSSEMNPEELISIGLDFNCQSEILLEEEAGYFTAIYARHAGELRALHKIVYRRHRGTTKTIDECTNNPLLGRREARSIRRIRAHLLDTLPPHMRPSSYLCWDELPRRRNGKMDRETLREVAAAKTRIISRRTVYRPFEMQLLDICERVLGRTDVSRDENFFDAGGNSLLAARFLAEIEQRLGITLPVATLLSCPTIASLADALDARERSSDIVTLRSGVGEPLYLFPDATGGLLGYRHLLMWLRGNYPVRGLEESRKMRPGSIGEAANEYAERIHAETLDLPIRLAGWSYGGLIAYEAASHLRSMGRVVKSVILIDTPAPLVSSQRNVDLLRACWRLQFARLMELAAGVEPTMKLSGLVTLQAQEQGSLVLDSLRLERVLPDDESLREAQRLMDHYMANVEALRTYAPALYKGTVLLCRAQDQTELSLLDPGYEWQSQDYGWSRSCGRLIVAASPGDHFRILDANNSKPLAGVIDGLWESADSEGLD